MGTAAVGLLEHLKEVPSINAMLIITLLCDSAILFSAMLQ